MKFAICPLQASYSVDPGTGVIATQLDGGRSRYRADVLNPCNLVSVAWALTATQYEYFTAFVGTILEAGALPFEIDLIIDGADMQEYTANFVPGSISLGSYSRGIFSISAQLEVEGILRDEAADIALVDEFNTGIHT